MDGRESYEFTWVGKREAIAEAGRPTTKTLRPDLDESVDFENSENVFITGDNLEVLKILQESYLGKIDMIYIDPPYNTGKDFVYSDKFQKTDEELKEEMELLDEEGRQVIGLTKNEKNSARYHSDWLNMMYPRLRLARNLLKDSGVIFISIDDNEQANLKAICDEIFGEENLVQTIAWRRSDNQPNIGKAARVKEYIYVYSKDYSRVTYGRLPLSDTAKKEYAYEDSKGKYGRGILRDEVRGRFNYEILSPAGKVLMGPWMVSEKDFHQLLKDDKIHWSENGGVPRTKIYLSDAMKNGQLSNDFWNVEFGTNQRANTEIKKLFDFRVFDFSKPTKLLLNLLGLGASIETALILDFFGGSGTTADAVMQLNAEDGGNRKFILCTLDEEVADKSAAKEAGYETIDQISRERIRRAAAKIQEEYPELVGKQDFGFKAYKLDSSNFKDVSARPNQFIQGELFDSVSNIKEGRTGLDLLFQVMLTWGMELSLAIDLEKVAGAEVYDVDQGSLMACFEDEISEEVIHHIAQAQPLRAVFRDSSFANSADKINVSEIFKELSPHTKVKVV
ncbi:site-specific DNA-methyltransferase [Streptococcus pseudopneumoniae]|uniref:Adenine-specific DNA methylase n=1 Tax=Streptococcus pseudopneumoniae TaxID=257758 RepID=A0A2P0A1Y9_9STRE|nr:site-specific DNA-methyltransferase [Streptococcus pseudopneumoniae]CEY65063.1 adenine-specific DNA methylase [Streptococcus pseudopneumoniae]